MNNCFVIQPFDGDKYDRRYTDIIKPAIEECGLYSYRVDQDDYVKIPIQEIEKHIRESKLVLAEISTDNPNIWYELGFAFACNKNVIMICSEERKTFPFDVQHKTIIKYKSESMSDFKKLHKAIVKKVKAYLESQNTLANFSNHLVQNIQGLSTHEIYTLVTIMAQQFSDEDSISQYNLIEKMKENGFNELATCIAVRKLEGIDYIVRESEFDQNSFDEYKYNAYKLTTKGIQWILDNEAKFNLKYSINPQISSEDNIPF